MIEFMIAQHQVAIAGRVLDAVTGKPVPGAHVEITQGAPGYTERLALLAEFGSSGGSTRTELGTTRTRPDGLFFFLDLPDGDYKLVAFLPKGGIYTKPPKEAGENSEDSFGWRGDKRYGKKQFDAKVPNGPGRLDRLAVIRLQPTGVTGRVVASANQSAVLMAEVRCKGSGERTFTDAQGQYTLARIQPNARQKRTLLVRARGYRDRPIEVLIDTPGVCKELPDVSLDTEKRVNGFTQPNLEV
ncbi:MAG: carboxypeptidase regulatory-like domain-containing protein [Silvibacterium sp.]|nr:carboxypeptidase regulatory-like domain-containing protein [Silvibacterium sp.]